MKFQKVFTPLVLRLLTANLSIAGQRWFNRRLSGQVRPDIATCDFRNVTSLLPKG